MTDRDHASTSAQATQAAQTARAVLLGASAATFAVALVLIAAALV